MKKIGVVFTILIGMMTGVSAQESTWGFGFYGDMQIRSPDYFGAFGLQAIYDFEGHQALQAQVYGRNGFVSTGVDYLFSFLDKGDHDFNIFLGAGVAQDFHRAGLIDDDNLAFDRRESETMFNAQLAVSYLFRDVGLSVYGGYKVRTRYDFKYTEPNHVMIGFRYYPWQ